MRLALYRCDNCGREDRGYYEFPPPGWPVFTNRPPELRPDVCSQRCAQETVERERAVQEKLDGSNVSA